ncbi:hypothetical protein GMDG_05990 [Pseudogymnoascus destructans 20631-21]|uniref:Uncharacterized protein n=1 Tax=Pseudogymnoascus destructans (strain ATCC MYA-4855 / 20631-21) TaxID=658429 RepID=L8FRJ3_PSED2|nr:hypothetical protein GMDG_05990 [Pseudogymnoascus destructans 20631-21]
MPKTHLPHHSQPYQRRPGPTAIRARIGDCQGWELHIFTTLRRSIGCREVDAQPPSSSSAMISFLLVRNLQASGMMPAVGIETKREPDSCLFPGSDLASHTNCPEMPGDKDTIVFFFFLISYPHLPAVSRANHEAEQRTQYYPQD